MTKIKVGRIDFLNILPIYHYFDQMKPENVEVVNKVPAVLNELLAKGEIDVGPISSFAYAQNASEYLLLPNLSVSSYGKVRSIFLISKKPIDLLQDSNIALTNTSATSIHLLKIILEKYYHIDANYDVMLPNLTNMLEYHDASLLIGDDAFVDEQVILDNNLFIYDLGELWRQLTGLSMTFAVWAVRKSSIEKFRESLLDVYHAFIDCKQLGKEDLNTIIDIANKKFERGHQFWKNYYEGLIYDFDQPMIDSLNKFFYDAFECGYLPEPVEVEVWREANESNR
ncbi:hypothetical protein BHU72_03815 [Desulfuribacillus stibiiarsenatis]|uniref:Chorismate dehydratase n=1 Tax=Desulfuribacillus stibiiarsenatis TaxID=1390249 RepID=A0A1E5L7E2_9FIRM|nr:menaquinone biosynthesis protein [Desulfuribacillus stibiiarsenatis]OEH85909.1 hypothetical protein BHU72_03815 [Desulfuribacillus stibiiarsenatis]